MSHTPGARPWAPLIGELAALTPQQPATVMWRIVELNHLLQTPEVPRTGVALDVGCGDGTIVELLRRHGLAWEVDGIDPDPTEVDLARARGLYRRLHVAPGDAIPEPDAAYDIAFSNSVLEHIPDLPATLAEVARLLKPGGLLIATVPTDGFNRCLRGPGPLAPLLGRTREEYLAGIDHRLAHVNLWSPDRWRAELDAVGMTASHMSAYLDRRDVRRWELVSNWTAGLLFGLARRKRTPMEISRSMRISTGSRLDRILAAIARPAVSLAMRRFTPHRGAASDPDYGCLLVIAQRRPAPTAT